MDHGMEWRIYLIPLQTVKNTDQYSSLGYNHVYLELA